MDPIIVKEDISCNLADRNLQELQDELLKVEYFMDYLHHKKRTIESAMTLIRHIKMMQSPSTSEDDEKSNQSEIYVKSWKSDDPV